MTEKIIHIISKLLEAEQLTQDEAEQLKVWREQSVHNEEVIQLLGDNQFLKEEILQREKYEENKQARYEELLQRISTEDKEEKVIPMRGGWWKWAVAAALIIGIGAYLWNINWQKEKPSLADTDPHPVKADIAPGGNKALLTLADGSTIVLDSAANGTVAEEGKTMVIKKNDGEIEYTSAVSRLSSADSQSPVSRLPPSQGSGGRSPSPDSQSPVSRLPSPDSQSPDSQSPDSYNTLTVPRGSQVVTVTLSDGSKVWLNADSKLTYPVAFVGKERRVEVEGEAYFDVAKDRSPFIVSVIKGDDSEDLSKKNKKNLFPSLREGSGVGSTQAEQQSSFEIEVLGTEFNVNAYADEPGIKASLVEGSVKIISRLPSDVSRLPSAVSRLTSHVYRLTPGQAYVNGKVTTTDLEQDIAWKNGRFLFNGATIETILRQASRWYDVQIKYEGKLPEANYIGDISRQKNISELLKILEQTGTVRFNIQGTTVTVRP